MNKYVVSIFLLILINWISPCYHYTQAQTREVVLSGKISNKKGEAIAQALIHAEQTDRGAYSNDKGLYHFKLQANQKYKITVSFIGYKTLTVDLVLDKNTTKNFVLEEDAVALDAVAVYGKNNNTRRKEDLFSVNSLEVGKQAAIVSNLNSIIGKSSGIKIREDGGVGGNFDMSINGLSGNSVRYFIDGVPMATMGAGVNVANLPVNIVDHVEIYKGVVPTHLGADALGGAVNIVTSKKKHNYIDASYGFGSFNTHKANLNAKYVAGKSGIIIKPMISFVFSNNNYLVKDVEVWNESNSKFEKGNRKRFHNDYLSFVGQIDIGVRNKRWADAFFVSTSYTKTEKELQTGSTQKIVYGAAERNSDNYKISARYIKRNFIIEKLKLNMLLSYTNRHSVTIDTVFRKYDWNGDYINSSRNEITGRSKSYRHYKRPLMIGRVNFDYKINSHHNLNFNYIVSSIYNKRYDEFDEDFEETEDSFVKHIFGLSYRQRFLNNRLINTFFVKDYLSYLEVKQNDLYWITGAQENAGKTQTNEIGYGAGSRFKLSEKLFFKTSYEHSMRLPLAREVLGNGTTVYPNFNLKPETGNNFNFGILGNIQSGGSNRFNYETNFFLRNTKNYIMLLISASDGLSQYENVASVEIKGVEGELSYNFNNKLKLKANASYIDERSKTKYQLNGKPDITYNNKVPNKPWLYANSGVEYSFYNVGIQGSQLKLAYDFQYVHWFYLTWEGYGSLKSKSTIPTQYVSNVNISYAFKQNKYNLSFDCSNIFNAMVYDNYMMQKPGRAFFVKMKVFID